MTRRRKSLYQRVLLNIANIGAILFLTLPLMVLLLGAFQTEAELIRNVENILPREITIQNFGIILLGKETAIYVPESLKTFPRILFNSTLVAISVTATILVFGVLSAYAVTRLEFRGSRTLSYLLLASRLVPGIVLLVPLYLTFRSLHMLNSLWGVVIAEVGFYLPYAVWILISYFQSLPSELMDAARVDGCSRLGSLIRILLPLAAPGIAATGAIIFMISWQDLLTPLILTSRAELMTVPLLLASLVTDFNIFYVVLMAVSAVGLTPSVVIAIFLRRYIIKGLTAGAVKG